MYANVTVENIITKGKRYDVKDTERIAPKVSFVGDDGNTHELNTRYFSESQEGSDLSVRSDKCESRLMIDGLSFAYRMQEEPTGYVGRFIGQCDGFTHLKNYNIEQVISGGECVRVRNDKGTLSIMGASLFEKLGEVTQEADEIDQRKSTKYRKQIPSGMEYLDVYRVCALFNVQDTTGGIHQAIKKLLAAGNRGYKNREEDLQEAIDAIQEVMKIDKEIE